jgi:predicted phosphodiesterase
MNPSRRRLLKSTVVILALLVAFTLGCSSTYAADRVKIAVWGDSRENLDNAVDHIADILLKEVTDWDFIIHTGDFSHAGKDQDWQRSLAYKGMRQMFVKGKFLMCTSNHDSHDRAAWDKYTAGVLPVNSADGTTHFSGFKFKNVNVVTCDPYFTDARTMQRWLDGYLAGVKPDEWLIAVWHCPTYGDLTYKEDTLKTNRPWLESLYRHGCDFVLNGHAHVYLRTKPLAPDGTVDEQKGIVHIINGVGGASWMNPQPYSNKTAFTPKVKSFPAITFLTLEGNTATVQTIDARPGQKRAVIDQLKRTKNR